MEITGQPARQHFIGLWAGPALTVHKENERMLVLRLSKAAFALPGVFMLIGAFLILWYFGALGDLLSGVQRVIVHPLIGCLFVIASLVIMLRWNTALIFDKVSATFSAQKVLPIFSIPLYRKSETPLDAIEAVQVFSASPESSSCCGCVPSTYEINLILRRPEGGTIGIVQKRQKAAADKLAQAIADFLEVPVINLASESCCL